MDGCVLTRNEVHSGFSTFSLVTLQFPDGRVVQREIEDHGDGVVVLPYDRERRVALLVRQPRVGLICQGEEPYHVEVPGGILEGHDPEGWARREAFEECGVRLDRLELIARAWTMAAVSTERVWMYLAPYILADRISAGGGCKNEDERLEVLEIPLAELDRDIASGRVKDLKTIALAFTLKLRNPDLFE